MSIYIRTTLLYSLPEACLTCQCGISPIKFLHPIMLHVIWSDSTSIRLWLYARGRMHAKLVHFFSFGCFSFCFFSFRFLLFFLLFSLLSSFYIDSLTGNFISFYNFPSQSMQQNKATYEYIYFLFIFFLCLFLLFFFFSFLFLSFYFYFLSFLQPMIYIYLFTCT